MNPGANESTRQLAWPAVLALHRAPDMESLWSATRALVSDAMPYHSCSLFSLDGLELKDARHHVATEELPGYVPAASLSVAHGFLRSHSRTGLYTYSQILAGDPDARRRRFAQEPVPGSWSEFVHLAFWSGDQPRAVLSVRRGPQHHEFTGRDLRFLQEMHPLIDAAVTRVHEAGEHRYRLAAFERALEHLQVPLLLLDENGREMFSIASAIPLIERWNRGVGGRDGGPRLPHDIPAMLHDPRRFRLRTVDTGGGHLYECAGVADLSLRIDHIDTATFGGGVSGGYLVTFVTRKQSLDSRRPQLNLLSPAELRVAMLVGEGLGNDQIARRLHRSRRTIEFQLSSIYRKLDIRHRTELVRLLIG